MSAVVTIPGVFIEVLGEGVLLAGVSGVGKSELALELISRGGRLVVDDAPEFYVAGGVGVAGACPEGLGEFLAHRDLGILNVRALFGAGAVVACARLGLIIELRRPGEGQGADEGPCLELSWDVRQVLGVDVDVVRLWVRPGRSLAVLVETLVRSYRLRQRGYDPYADFTRRQEALMAVERGNGER